MSQFDAQSSPVDVFRSWISFLPVSAYEVCIWETVQHLPHEVKVCDSDCITVNIGVHCPNYVWCLSALLLFFRQQATLESWYTLVRMTVCVSS